MNWDALGAIAELLGAIAVFLTLAYLTVQVRQNSAALKQQNQFSAAQIMLFLFLFSAAVGVLIGGIIGDRIGRYWIIWISVLGPLPFTLILPYMDLFWTGVLTVLINLIMASAFASILIYAIDLLPNRIGLIGGLFYGLNFVLGGIAAGVLGALTENFGVETVYLICSFMPLAGLMACFLPRIEET